MNEKKNKTKLKIVELLFILVILLACIIGGIIYFTQRDDDQFDYIEAKKVVSDFLEAYKTKDSSANTYISGTFADDEIVTYEGYQGCCAEKINYKIIDVSKGDSDSELITVTVEIQNLDLTTVLNKLNEKSFDNDEEIIEHFYSLIQSDDAPTYTYQCDIKCKQYPTGMKILFDAELSNALLGGYSAYVVGNDNL